MLNDGGPRSAGGTSGRILWLEIELPVSAARVTLLCSDCVFFKTTWNSAVMLNTPSQKENKTGLELDTTFHLKCETISI